VCTRLYRIPQSLAKSRHERLSTSSACQRTPQSLIFEAV
jgi:hypothetical protein